MPIALGEVLDRVGAFFMKQSPQHEALRRLTTELDRMGIAYVVAGAMAVNAHGHHRTTADIDVLMTRDGLAAFKERWLGRGWVDVFPGSKGMRDVVANVKVDVLLAGEHPGDGKHPRPAGRFPRPRVRRAEVPGDVGTGPGSRGGVSVVFVVSVLLGCAPDEPVEDEAPAEADTVAAPWPEWAWRHWVWEDEGTSDSALAHVDGYLDRGIDVGAVIIDSPWATGYSTFEFDPALYPDPQGMVDAFHDRGVRVMLWTVPAINVDVPDLYEEAASKGYFMQRDATSGPAVLSWWKGEGSLIDYFNPEAVEWWHGLVDPVLDLGIDGWKCDGLDYSAFLAPYSPGAGRDVDRLEYSHAYYEDFFEYTRERLGEDRIITARPVDNYGLGVGGEAVSFAPVDLNWAGWVGDQDPDFAGLEAALDNLYESSLLGYVGFGSDIGGYRENGDLPLGRTKEAFVRWAELGALCPVMENGGGGEHRPWMFDEETLAIYADFVELHEALLPYLTDQGATAFSEGRSLVTFEDDETYTYRLGSDLFVAPFLEEGTEIEVSFPAGDDWRYAFSATAYEGGTSATLDIPLHEFPVFVRAGSELDAELAL